MVNFNCNSNVFRNIHDKLPSNCPCCLFSWLTCTVLLAIRSSSCYCTALEEEGINFATNGIKRSETEASRRDG